jgi:Flp pilus assembly protein protease CpaA
MDSASAMASALLVSGFYFLLFLLTGRNIGLGDVKFAGACSSVLSHQSETLGAFLVLTWTCRRAASCDCAMAKK